LSQRKEGIMRRPAHPIPLIPSPINPRSPWLPSFYASPAPSPNPHLEAVLSWSADDVVAFVSNVDRCSKYAKARLAALILLLSFIGIFTEVQRHWHHGHFSALFEH
jgi:hypothetical protein